jgi:DNA-binding NarL/FixJ family response regulator
MEKIRVLLVDDNNNVRNGLRKMLSRSSEVEVVGEAGNGGEALQLVQDLDPDILLLDVEMPGMKGYEVARRLRESGSSSRVLALSGYDEKDYIYGMLTNGAVGYLTKDDAPRYLLSAVKEIATGSRGWVSPNIAEQLGVQARSEDGEEIPKLTKLEVSILELLADGKTDVEIGLELDRKHKNVLERIESINKKMGVETSLDAVLRAIQEGIL